MKNNKNTAKFVSILLAAVMLLGLCVSAFAAYDTPSFTDMPKNHWAYTYVEQAHEKGWINGVGDGSFQPNANVTYAQMCVMLDQAFFSDKLAAYTGAKQPWYAPYTNVAAQVGLLEGTNVEKAPTDAAKVNEPCSRMEMALILYNAMLASGGKVPTDEEQSAAAYATPDVPYYENPHLRAIVVCKAAGIINGVDSKGTFAGRDNMTRAQAAVVMVKLDEYLSGAGSGTTNPGTTDDPKPETPSNPTGGKDSNGYTLASGVKSSVGKSDSYPTKGRETTANRNGYFTAADVDIGEAVLEYDFLALVNEARRAEGLNELTWVPTDAMEEYTLLRAKELTMKYSHIRPNEEYKFLRENIASGYPNVQSMFSGWMNSTDHRASIMDDAKTSMCAARCGNYWVMTFGADGFVNLVDNGAETNYTSYNGW